MYVAKPHVQIYFAEVSSCYFGYTFVLYPKFLIVNQICLCY